MYSRWPKRADRGCSSTREALEPPETIRPSRQFNSSRGCTTPHPLDMVSRRSCNMFAVLLTRRCYSSYDLNATSWLQCVILPRCHHDVAIRADGPRMAGMPFLLCKDSIFTDGGRRNLQRLGRASTMIDRSSTADSEVSFDNPDAWNQSK